MLFRETFDLQMAERNFYSAPEVGRRLDSRQWHSTLEVGNDLVCLRIIVLWSLDSPISHFSTHTSNRLPHYLSLKYSMPRTKPLVIQTMIQVLHQLTKIVAHASELSRSS